MKKILALGAATLCTLGMAGGAFAAEVTTPGETQIDAEYSVGSTYKVTIPSGITFEGFNDDEEVAVVASDVYLENGYALKVSMTSKYGALVNGDNSSIAYTVKNGDDDPETIATDKAFDILSVTASNVDGSTANLTFTSGDDVNVTLAGKHSDTLTFNVEIASTPEEIVTSSFTDARDGKEYTTAQIAVLV